MIFQPQIHPDNVKCNSFILQFNYQYTIEFIFWIPFKFYIHLL